MSAECVLSANDEWRMEATRMMGTETNAERRNVQPFGGDQSLPGLRKSY